ncbi:FecR domain-containing protein [Chitinophaga caseinilytica]|uniref:FecR domain-containing protein n=1 Tax=Chitinophaga caseinilytica TaxID=2267521 RepID=A0ABZ2ZDK2_9BACT
MTREAIISSLEKYAAGTLTPEEERSLFAWLETAPPHEFHALLDAAGVPDALKSYPMPTSASVADFRRKLELREPVPERTFWQKLTGRAAFHRPFEPTEPVPAHRLRPTWRKIAAAAAVLLLAGGSYWLFQATPQPGKNHVVLHSGPQPGGNKATLTLGDGSIITLDDADAGALSQQGNTKIVKLQGGRIVYDPQADGGAPVFNTISTPKGGQYQVQLPDGTVVWMNAASSLRFPSAFTGNERLVELTGEGYFEVAADVEKPFKVAVKDVRVEVLGTKFNINAYPEESQARAALLEGSVRVRRKDDAVKLAPGQEARIGQEGKIAVSPADLEQVLAWKNGYFQFEGATLPVLLRQIGRWYDVEVVWKGEVPEKEFAGRISRNVSLEAMVEALRSSGVNCKITGRTLEVAP